MEQTFEEIVALALIHTYQMVDIRPSDYGVEYD